MSDRADRIAALLAEIERLNSRIGGGPQESASEDWTVMAGLIQRVLREVQGQNEDWQSDLQQMTRRMERLARNQEWLDNRLLPLEYSRVFRTLRWAGRAVASMKSRAGQLLLHSPLHPAYVRMFQRSPGENAYALWLEVERKLTGDASSLKERARGFRRCPRVSILMPTHNPVRKWLDEAVQSVIGQTYEDWELCVCDDASTELWVEQYFREKSSADTRIRFIRSGQRAGIAGATNRAGELGAGEYVGFLDQDDLLPPYALHYVVEALQRHDPILVYSDEDKIDASGCRSMPAFKPAWDAELLSGCMYLGHFLVVRRAELDAVGWLRSEFDGSQDYDLALRLTEREGVVSHIPRILYHWRRHDASTSGNPAAKPYAQDAARRALEGAVERRGWQARVESGELPGSFRLRREWARLSASVIICSRDRRLLRRCLHELKRTARDSIPEIVVVDHRTGGRRPLEPRIDEIECVVVPYEGPFNFSSMCNRGAAAASGEVFIFLNDDTEPLSPGWLAALLAQAARPEVGVAGGRLLYPSGAVQHAGIAIGITGGAGHPERGHFDTPYWKWGRMARNVSAVTGACLAIRRQVFDELGGFDPAFPVNYNDVDLCLRARRAGYAVVCEPAALLRHFEGQTRVALVRYRERELLAERWGDELERGDFFYSPNLSTASEDASLQMDYGPHAGLACRTLSCRYGALPPLDDRDRG
jgi:O-antigen biosynthesis protein